MGSDLVPWPSGIVMPIVVLVFYSSIKILHQINIKANLFLIGILIPIIVFTRFQIGILSFASTVIVLTYNRRWDFYFWFFFGFITSFGAIIIFLSRLGWLNDAIYDELVFGLTYLSADKSTFPKPVITFSGISLVVLFLLFLSRYEYFRIYVRRVKFLLAFITILLPSVLFYILWKRKLDILQTEVVVTRRFWIMIVLGSVLFLLVDLFRNFFLRKNSIRFFLSENRKTIILFVFSASLQSQAYPLFDQMHFWWGSPISFLTLTVVFAGVLRDLKLKASHYKFFSLSLAVILSISILVPWINQISKPKLEFPPMIGSKIYAYPTSTREQESLYRFFQSNMPIGSSVLNLCDDTNVYFSAGLYHPSSRFFVLWAEQMSHAKQIFNNMRNSNPDFVLTCDLTHAPALRTTQELMRDKLMAGMSGSRILIGTYVGVENKHWSIYRSLRN